MNEVKKSTVLLCKIALLVAALIWGGSFVVLKTALDNMTIFNLFSIRFLCGTLLLSVIFIKHFKNFSKEYVIPALLIGGALFLAYVIQTYGLAYTTPGKNAFLTDVYCILVPMFTWIFSKKKPDKFNFIAAFFCLAGIGCISLTSDFTINIGDALSLLCSVFFGLHIVFTAVFAKDKDAVLMTILQFLVAGILFLICALIFEKPSVIKGESLLQLGYLILLATCAALLLQNIGIKYTSPAAGAILLTMESVFGVILSIIFKMDHPEIKDYIGFALIFISVVISETKLNFIKFLKPDKMKCKSIDKIQ